MAGGIIAADSAKCAAIHRFLTAVLTVGVLTAGYIVFADVHTTDETGKSFKETDLTILQEKLDVSMSALTNSGKTVNAIMIDERGNTVASIGDSEISVIPGSAAAPLAAAALIKNDAEIMNETVPSDGFSVDGQWNVRNWLIGYHDGKDISLKEAFKEMSNAGRVYALMNVNTSAVNDMAELYGLNDISADDETTRYMMAMGQYKIRLDTLVKATAKVMEDENAAFQSDPAQGSEIRKMFMDSLNWYFQYRAETGDCDLTMGKVFQGIILRILSIRYLNDYCKVKR
jgi:hypothetical protein